MKDTLNGLTLFLFLGGICAMVSGLTQLNTKSEKMLEIGVWMIFFGCLGILFIKMYF